MALETEATGSLVAGPERPGGQGLDPHQEESGNLAILRLLTGDEGGAWTDFVATYRHDDDGGGAYEAWAARGMVRWTREIGADGRFAYRVIEVLGENPLERQDSRVLATLAEELAAGEDGTSPERAFIPPERLTYPYAYERLSALFDSPNGPDLAVNPRSYAYGRQPGQHGALDVVQSRSPLIFSGPGVRRGERVEVEARQIDVAPTIVHLLGFPLIDGADATGRTSTERGVAPDVYLRRQDGRVLSEVLDPERGRPERVYILLLDGQSHTELLHRLENDAAGIPHLARLIGDGALLRWGSITNFPSITWPSHNAIGTGCWSGHHDIVNPTYYLRDRRERVSPQGQAFDTARFLSPAVETLFEACTRVYGEEAFTASINEPCTRGATHASLERRLVGDITELKRLTAETASEISPRWERELRQFNHHQDGIIDNRGLAQARLLLADTSHPVSALVYHEFSLTDSAAHDYGPHSEGAHEALDETDRRVGHILHALEERGALDGTLFVITTDHGMARQNTELRANPAMIPQRSGMATVTTEPLIYLRDLHVTVEMAHDGRTARVTVLDNDADASGERPSVAGAAIVARDARDGDVDRVTTDAHGVAGLAIPADLLPSEITATVRVQGYNPRTLRLDGTSVAIDLRRALYGDAFAGVGA